MIFPENNSTQLSDQKNYTLIHNVVDNIETPLESQCGTDSSSGDQNDDSDSTEVTPCSVDDTITNCQYIGHAVAILRMDDINITAKVQRYSYVVNSNDNGAYYVDDMVTHYSDTESSQHATWVASALRLAMAATEGTNVAFIRDVLQMDTQYSARDNSVAKNATLAQLFSKDANSFNAIDKAHTIVSLHGVNVTNTTVLNQYVNNTYINIVHDCNSICTQSVLSNAPNFMSIRDVKQHGLWCANILSTYTTDMLTTNHSDVTTTVNKTIANANDTSAATVAASVVGVLCLSMCGAFTLFIQRSKSQFAQNTRNRLARMVHNIMCCTHRAAKYVDVEQAERTQEAPEAQDPQTTQTVETRELPTVHESSELEQLLYVERQNYSDSDPQSGEDVPQEDIHTTNDAVSLSRTNNDDKDAQKPLEPETKEQTPNTVDTEKQLSTNSASSFLQELQATFHSRSQLYCTDTEVNTSLANMFEPEDNEQEKTNKEDSVHNSVSSASHDSPCHSSQHSLQTLYVADR